MAVATGLRNPFAHFEFLYIFAILVITTKSGNTEKCGDCGAEVSLPNVCLFFLVDQRTFQFSSNTNQKNIHWLGTY